MAQQPPRVAFFADSYDEVNGVARTSRALAAWAGRAGLPLLCVHGGRQTKYVGDGQQADLELRRSRVALRLDADLRCDLLWARHARRAMTAARTFEAEVIHLTGPNDMGQLAAYVAHRRRLPVVASWHTNVHDYAAHRLERRLRALPAPARAHVVRWTRRRVLSATVRFYRTARAVLAPNDRLVRLLGRLTGRPTFLMRRGVDVELFSPSRRRATDAIFRLGYVGRLRPEKNVRALARLEHALLAAGLRGFQFVIVGDGSERPWLEQQMTTAAFAGVLSGVDLARAYADMDVFLFPSETDTFGNAVLEALAAGTPAVVSPRGGPASIVRHGTSGYVAPDDAAWMDLVRRLMTDTAGHQRMREAARQQALETSWDAVFEQVRDVYIRVAREQRESRG